MTKTLQTIANLVYTAKAHGASHDELSIITSSYWKKLKKRYVNVYKHWDDPDASDEVRQDFEDEAEVTSMLMDDMFTSFNPFDYKELCSAVDWRKDDGDYCHPAWRKFQAKFLQELTDKLVKLVNDKRSFTV